MRRHLPPPLRFMVHAENLGIASRSLSERFASSPGSLLTIKAKLGFLPATASLFGYFAHIVSLAALRHLFIILELAQSARALFWERFKQANTLSVVPGLGHFNQPIRFLALDGPRQLISIPPALRCSSSAEPSGELPIGHPTIVSSTVVHCPCLASPGTVGNLSARGQRIRD